MESWETLYTLFQTEAQNEDATVLTAGKADINRGIHILETELDLPPLERTRSITTVTSTDSYALPHNFVRLKELYSTVSNIRYVAEKVYDERTWQAIKANTSSFTSDILSHVFVRPGSNSFEIYPKAATAGNTMTMVYESFSKDLSQDDYTDGTITTLANGGTAITGSSTTFTSAMAGRWFKIDADNEWYLIDSYTSATAITLKQAYQGTAISAGTSTYTIGEMSRLPVGTLQRAPVSYALWRFFLTQRRDAKLASLHEKDWENAKIIARDLARKHVSSIVPSIRRLRRSFGLRNPNAYPMGITDTD